MFAALLRFPIVLLRLLCVAAISLQDLSAIYKHAAELNSQLFAPAQDGTTHVRSGDIDALE